MPLKEFTGGGGRAHKTRITKTKAPSAGKTHKAKQAKQGRAKKTAAKKAPAARQFHEQAQTSAGAEHPTTAGLPFGGSGSTAGASPRAVMELTGLGATSPEGLGGAILDLVGEGRLTVAHALAAWTHEQDRLANRAWRRPGGLQRMAGL